MRALLVSLIAVLACLSFPLAGAAVCANGAEGRWCAGSASNGQTCDTYDGTTQRQGVEGWSPEGSHVFAGESSAYACDSHGTEARHGWGTDADLDGNTVVVMWAHDWGTYDDSCWVEAPFQTVTYACGKLVPPTAPLTLP